jgi:hypothetical protein
MWSWSRCDFANPTFDKFSTWTARATWLLWIQLTDNLTGIPARNPSLRPLHSGSCYSELRGNSTLLIFIPVSNSTVSLRGRGQHATYLAVIGKGNVKAKTTRRHGNSPPVRHIATTRVMGRNENHHGHTHWIDLSDRSIKDWSITVVVSVFGKESEQRSPRSTDFSLTTCLVSKFGEWIVRDVPCQCVRSGHAF